MNISKTYDPSIVEDKWYSYWKENNFFKSLPDNREPFTIVIPPPNVTGVLHMGHILNNTIQDVLIRKARMEGKNACWVPGTDHASIATEAKVVDMLKQKGIKKKDLTREEFLKYAWEWKEKHGNIILEQLKKIGASCDWDRTRFTLEESLSNAVIQVFIDLYKKGLIYKGARMVNWDPQALTVVSDEEVIYKEVQSKLYFVKYKIENSENEWVTIATTRPETILGDTAICINPEDKRYKHLKNKKALVPLINRSIPIIFDEYVDMEFGTGCLKITPAHDLNDYELGIKHKLASIDIFNDNGTLSQNAGLYISEDRFAARKKIIIDLNNTGQLVKTEDYVNKIGFSERTDAVIEPKLSKQWFLKMSELGKPALENVLNDKIRFFPNKYKNTYRYWMENIRDWCISRQLWWGHRIPVYYCKCKECMDVVIVSASMPDKCYKCGCTDHLYQDEDVLDTWFSAWLWPISVFDGFKDSNNKDINYYYPTDVLVTAPEILFFWVARMVMAGYEYRKDLPFRDVYLTGTVRDMTGRKMSKSLGNSPDPLDLIKKYGADAVRTGMLFCSPAGNDLLFDETLCEQGRNFSNKLWNAFRLIKSWNTDAAIEQDISNKYAVEWFTAKFNETLMVIDDHYTKYRISDALITIYKLIWDDFCAWYLEMVKPAFQQSIDNKTYSETVILLEKLLKVLHPFMPFITEEIWHLLNDKANNNCIINAKYPKPEKYDAQIIQDFDRIISVITNIRSFRNQKKLLQKKQLTLFIKTEKKGIYNKYEKMIKKLSNVSEIGFSNKKDDTVTSFVVKNDEFFIPLESVVNIETEVKRINNELEHLRSFLDTVNTKLNNERFITNAKEEIIEKEKQKKTDAEAKIKILTNNLDELVS